MGRIQSCGALEAYNGFLLDGSKALTTFASAEHQALTRLLLLSNADDHENATRIRRAFERLNPAERADLTCWLTADGISNDGPGFVLTEASTLLRNSQDSSLDILDVLRSLVQVQDQVRAAMWAVPLPVEPKKVVLHLGQLAALAEHAGNGQVGSFRSADIEVVFDPIQADSEVWRFTVNVREASSDGVCAPLLNCFRCHGYFWNRLGRGMCVVLSIVLCLVSLLILLGSFWVWRHPESIELLPHIIADSLPDSWPAWAPAALLGGGGIITSLICFFGVGLGKRLLLGMFRKDAVQMVALPSREENSREPLLQRTSNGYQRLANDDDDNV